MSIEERIVAVVSPIVAVCQPEEYTPESGEAVAEEYCVYSVSLAPMAYGDNAPRLLRGLVQLHWYLPRGRDPRQTRQALARGLQQAGFTYPEITNASDEDGQHWVFECEATEVA